MRDLWGEKSPKPIDTALKAPYPYRVLRAVAVSGEPGIANIHSEQRRISWSSSSPILA